MELPTLHEIQKFLVDQFLNNQFFTAAGIVGIFGIILNYTKNVPLNIYNRIKRKVVFVVLIDRNSNMYDYLESWFKLNCNSVYRNIEATTNLSLINNDDNYYFDEDSYYEENTVDKKIKEFIIYRHSSDVFYLRRGLQYIRVEKSREKLDNASSTKDPYYHSFKLKSLFSKKVITKFLEEVLQLHIEEIKMGMKEEVDIYTNDSYKWNKERSIEFKPLDLIKTKVKVELLNDLDAFLKNKAWYKERGIPYKRGILLYGEPGTGKTSLSIAIANHYKLPIYVLTPQRLTDNDLFGLFRKLNRNSILLVEDIDAFFMKRDSKLNFNFSTFLNCLDGVYSKEGIITIFTTNNLSVLDEALIREGRIDLKLKLSYPDEEEIQEYLSSFYNIPINLKLTKENKLPMAYIQEICIKNKNNPEIAIKKIQENEKEKYI